MEIFYQEKAFQAGEKIQEKWLCPLRKIFLLCPGWVLCQAVFFWAASSIVNICFTIQKKVKTSNWAIIAKNLKFGRLLNFGEKYAKLNTAFGCVHTADM